MILAGDIGGTKCKLALFEPPVTAGARPRLMTDRRFASRDYGHLEDVVEEFCVNHKGKITAAGFGVAGPVIGNQVRATNLPWLVDGPGLARILGIRHTSLLNDLEATGYGLRLLEPGEMDSLNPGQADPTANQALIAAGTGLGEAILFYRDGRRFVAGTEGGHTDFAPRTEEEIGLLRFLKQRQPNVSWENVLSGSAFRAIHEFLAPSVRHSSFDDPSADSAPEISQLGETGKCPVCAKALDLWVAMYGAEAGNLALKTLARGGVFVAGGIAVKLRDRMRNGRFLRAFCDKSRFSDMLKRIPVYLVLNQDAPVLGAASVAAEQAGKG
jgi:glucokinase